VATVGRVHPHVEVKVVDPDSGRVVPRGAPGELCTRGYVVMLGYWENQAATGQAIDRAGWMHTGDLATLDQDGYANIVGRIKDMVIRGGENIYPREVEEFLYQHPAVSDVQAVGVPDERYGEELCAWVPGPDRQLQDPPLLAVRGRVPDDGHRQGAEVQDARGLHRRAGPGGGRAHRHRLSRKTSRASAPTRRGRAPATRSTTGRPACLGRVIRMAPRLSMARSNL
jgi:AMP-binding enzyme/AMP-binding enzyme C-terminal domain